MIQKRMQKASFFLSGLTIINYKRHHKEIVQDVVVFDSLLVLVDLSILAPCLQAKEDGTFRQRGRGPRDERQQTQETSATSHVWGWKQLIHFRKDGQTLTF